MPTAVNHGADLAERCLHDVARDADPNYPDSLKLADTRAQRAAPRDTARLSAVHKALAAYHPDMVAIPPQDGPAAVSAAKREQLTAAAMADGARLIWNGRLPSDPDGRRAGGPDLLVRGPGRSDGRWAYLPVDAVRGGFYPERRFAAGRVSDLAGPTYEGAVDVRHGSMQPRHGLRLCHYLRMLQACGHAQDDGPLIAGIIARDALIHWADMSQATRQYLDEDGRAAEGLILDKYDADFAARVDVWDRAAARRPGDPQVVPLCTRWATCKDWSPWADVAHAELVEADAIALIPGARRGQVVGLARRGVTTRADLAAIEDVVGFISVRETTASLGT